jgi:hypothetical protein
MLRDRRLRRKAANVRAFFKDLFTGMRGPLRVRFAAVAIWVSSGAQKVLLGSVAVVFALFSSHRVWRDERRSWAALLKEAC